MSTRFRGPRSRRFSVAPRLESLEDRTLLAQAASNTFAVLTGEVGPSAVLSHDLRVDASRFGLTRRGVLLGFSASPEAAEPGPGRVRVSLVGPPRRQAVRVKPPASPVGSTLALSWVKAGSLSAVVASEAGHSGAYAVQAFLAGDADGDFRVTNADLQRIRSLRRVRSTDARYDLAADVDRNGIINDGDAKLARSNLGASTQVRPLGLTSSVETGELVGGFVVGRALAVVGSTSPLAELRLEQGGDGRPATSLIADASGSYRFPVDVDPGTTSFRVTASDVFGERVAVETSVDRRDLATDTSAPRIEIVSGDSAPLVNRNLVFQGRVTDLWSGVASLQAQLDDVAFVDVAFDAAGSFSWTTDLPLGGPADGAHSVAFRARDFAGNVVSETAWTSGLAARHAFELDTVGIRVVDGAPSGTYSWTPDQVDLTFSERPAGASWWESPYASFVGPRGDALTFGWGSMSYESSTINFDMGHLSWDLYSGEYTFRLEPGITDRAGNPLEGPSEFRFSIVRPIGIASVSPREGSTIPSWEDAKFKVRFDGLIDSFESGALQLIVDGAPRTDRIVIELEPKRLGLDLELFGTDFTAGTTVELVIDGDAILARDGTPVDADGDGFPGGRRTIRYETASFDLVPETTIHGYVYDADSPADAPIPVVGATVQLIPVFVSQWGQGAFSTTTDASGYFEIGLGDANGDGVADGVPVPEAFLMIDGKQAVTESGYRYLSIYRAFRSFPGRRNRLEIDNALMDVDPNTPGSQIDLYLPKLAKSDIHDRALRQAPRVGPEGKARMRAAYPDLDPRVFDEFRLDGLSDFDWYGSSGFDESAIVPLHFDRLPVPKPPVASPRFAFAIVGTQFAWAGVNLPLFSNGKHSGYGIDIRFPNLEEIAPHDDVLIWKYDQRSDDWTLVGSRRVSFDGLSLWSRYEEEFGFDEPGLFFVSEGSPTRIVVSPIPGNLVGSGADFTSGDHPALPSDSIAALLIEEARVFDDEQLIDRMGLIRSTGYWENRYLERFLLRKPSSEKEYHDFHSFSITREPEDTPNSVIKATVRRLRADLHRRLQLQAEHGYLDDLELHTDTALFSKLRTPVIEGSDGLGDRHPPLLEGSQGGEIHYLDWNVTIESLGGGAGSGVTGRGHYSVDLCWELLYDFGVDASSVDSRETAAFWVLQHERGYTPFAVRRFWILEEPITGSFIIPEEFTEFDNRIPDGTRPSEGVAPLPPPEPVGPTPPTWFGVDPVIHYRVVADDGTELAGTVAAPGGVPIEVVLPSGVGYVAYLYQPSTGRTSAISSRTLEYTDPYWDWAQLPWFRDPRVRRVVQLGPPDDSDWDGDGIPDLGELVLGTDRLRADTDGDGRTDAEELTHRQNPLDPR
ncbi:MAG: hypothetical protein SFX72_01750 [Isosphaeraceae bacterium]|nr:hypothetical protein [Isosphaeraceae bacterium]